MSGNRELHDETHPFDGERDPWETVYLPNATSIASSRIGRYRQIRKLGEGEFGVVWLGFDEQLERPIAIKITKLRGERSETAREGGPSARDAVGRDELELREARYVALLDHPNIVPVYDIGMTHDQRVYVISKYIEGETLRDLLERRRLSVVESLRMVHAIAEALAHAHDKGLVHRDIKPANILIDQSTGRPHITDFGLALRRMGRTEETGWAGTPNYMSPEQARGDVAAIDARSDLFSLGVILYELLTERLPFRANSLLELFDQILHADPLRLSTALEAESVGGVAVGPVDEDVEALCQRALSKSPEMRFASAKAMADAIEACLRKREDKPLVEAHATTAAKGSLLGEYRLLELIGSGGWGEIYRAEHRVMKRPVAVKLLHLKGETQPGTMQRFLHEIRMLSKLSHPHIVTALDAGKEADRLYLVMELIEGESLGERLARLGPLSTAEAMHTVRQTAMALEYAHSMRLIHRDIKPGNLMVTQEGAIKVLDFGLATLQSEQAGSAARDRVGTPHFMAPEQAIEGEAVDARADLYALGATLFTLLTGRPMFDGTTAEIVRCHAENEAPKLYEARPGIDLRVDSLYHRLVAKDPEQRFPSARALLDELDRLRLPECNIRWVSNQIYLKGLFRSQPASVQEDGFDGGKTNAVLGIDLGLGSSTVAWHHPQLGPQCIEPSDGDGFQLRNMLWSREDQVKLGADAMAMRQVHPHGIFHSLQRWIGLERVQRPFGGRSVPPEVLIAAVLHRLFVSARSKLPSARQAVVTIPSCYDQLHRRSIAAACHIAGIELLQLLDKPLAVVLSWLHSLNRSSGGQRLTSGRILVVHLGGTGLDASVVQVDGAVVRLLGTQGDWKFGSQRWIHLMTQAYASELHRLTGCDIRSDIYAATRLQTTLELVVDRLTTKPFVDMRFEWRGAILAERLTHRQVLEKIPTLRKELVEAIVGACDAASTRMDEIQHVILAGVLMRLPTLREMVESVVPNATSLSLVAKNELARGAALQAFALSGADSATANAYRAVSSLVYDFALPIKQSGTTVLRPKRLLERGGSFPTAITRTLRFEETLPQDLALIESTRGNVDVWQRIGALELASAFPHHPRAEPLQLRLEVDLSGILHATLKSPTQRHEVPIPMLGDRLTFAERVEWRSWLETLMLCSGA